MLCDLSLVILREIIVTIIDYESIINLKLTNKRIFNFINNDIVIQRYHLKLRYNLTIGDENLSKYIKLLDSKFYSKFIIGKCYFDEENSCLLVDPENDNFLLWNVTLENDVQNSSIIIYCSEKIYDKLIILFKTSIGECIEDVIFSQGFITLNSEISEFVKTNIHRIQERSFKFVLLLGPQTVPSISIKVLNESFNDKILTLIKEM